MFCKKCGEEINDEAVVCPKCGCAVEENKKPAEIDKPKTGIGVVMGLFLGLIGLIIGICLYKEGTIARKTFIKSWVITYVVVIVVSVVIGIISYVISYNALMDSLNGLY